MWTKQDNKENEENESSSLETMKKEKWDILDEKTTPEVTLPFDYQQTSCATFWLTWDFGVEVSARRRLERIKKEKQENRKYSRKKEENEEC